MLNHEFSIAIIKVKLFLLLCIIINKIVSENSSRDGFQAQRGLRQVDWLAILLFDLVTETAIKIFRINTDEPFITIHSNVNIRINFHTR